MADIISAVEDTSPITKLHDAALVQDMAQDLWNAMNAKLLDFMQSVTLRSLMLEQLAKGVKIEQKPAPTRGVFKRPNRQTVRPNVPNSVFALGKSMLARS